MSENSLQIYIVRHGATEWSESKKHTGLTDLPLLVSGTEGASKVGRALHGIPFSAVYTSPLKRARKTCEIASVGAIPPIVDEDLLEWNYGDYEGVTTKEIREKVPNWTIFNSPIPNGESIADVANRADRFLQKIEKHSGNVAVFSSGHISAVLIARFLRISPKMGAHFILDTGSISILSYHRETPSIKLLNYVPKE